MNECVVCGKSLSTENGNICLSCQLKYSQRSDLCVRDNEVRRLTLLLEMERTEKRRLSAAYAKADHDRKRYAKYIKFLQSRYSALIVATHKVWAANRRFEHHVKALEEQLTKEANMLNLNKFAKEVHQNAVEHGWWETDRDIEEVASLIHSEWSEALEESRAGRPMRYFPCNAGGLCVDDRPGENVSCGSRIYDPANPKADCSAKSKKPEGIAVELIDGCIRILDYAGKNEFYLIPLSEFCMSDRYWVSELARKDLVHLVAALHSFTVDATKKGRWYFSLIIAVVFEWIRVNSDLDPEKLMQEKHQYNKTRPYKHGKKF